MKSKLNGLTESIKDSTTREKVLKKVRHALLEPSDNPFPDLDIESSVYSNSEEEKDIQFAYELVNWGGKFIYCSSPNDMLNKVKALFAENNWSQACCNEDLIAGLLKHAGVDTYENNKDTTFHKIGVTSCECLIARTGSILVSSSQDSGRRIPFTSDIHIVIAFTSQVVEDIRHGLDFMRRKYGPRLPSMISIISGTSRSADIENILTPVGHAARELFVFMADEDSTDN
jgi:L-lactate dehydrogenase complex protein LldG